MKLVKFTSGGTDYWLNIERIEVLAPAGNDATIVQVGGEVHSIDQSIDEVIELIKEAKD